jgi:cell fate regulator YaaT (PSP1 superfamily)
MPDVIGIRFKQCGKIYNFEINGSGEELKRGDLVIVESDLGLSIGKIIIELHTIENTEKELKKVLRKATEDDLRQKKENENYEEEARMYCIERIMARGLPMKLVCTEATLDKKRIIFYFTADGRIDFREIVKDLAAKFKTRIEMRQIGVRDEAKIIGGLGICGKELCCKTFLTSFEPISIKMAKQQDLVLNMSKLSGVCGRLMCCLGYECSDEIPCSNPPEADEIALTMNLDNTEIVELDNITPEKIVEETSQEEAQIPVVGNEEPIPSRTSSEKETLMPTRVGTKDNENNPPSPPFNKGGMGGFSEKTKKDVCVEEKPAQGHRRRKKWRWRKFHKK